jgi:hypothetical protein
VGEKKKFRGFISYYHGGTANLRAEFEALAEQWRQETMFSSSLSEISFHPAYQSIVGMGRPALPLILNDLEQHLDHWFYALRHIARIDVAEGATNLEDARQRWIAWGRSEKYL